MTTTIILTFEMIRSLVSFFYVLKFLQKTVFLFVAVEIRGGVFAFFATKVSVVALLLGAGPSLHFLPPSLRKAQRAEPFVPLTRTASWCFENWRARGVKPPKSSILIGFSIINHPFGGTLFCWKHPCGGGGFKYYFFHPDPWGDDPI